MLFNEEINPKIFTEDPLCAGFPWWSSGKESACREGGTRDAGSITELGSSSGRGLGTPLQYSCLESPRDRGAWQGAVHGVTESDRTEATEPARTMGMALFWTLENMTDRRIDR